MKNYSEKNTTRLSHLILYLITHLYLGVNSVGDFGRAVKAM